LGISYSESFPAVSIITGIFARRLRVLIWGRGSHGEFGDLGKDLLHFVAMIRRDIARVSSESHDALEEEFIRPPLDLGVVEVVGSGEFGGSDSAFDDVHDSGVRCPVYPSFPI
jgi:hypothetical protein